MEEELSEEFRPFIENREVGDPFLLFTLELKVEAWILDELRHIMFSTTRILMRKTP